jgi:hypothetical protein
LEAAEEESNLFLEPEALPRSDAAKA